jgi:hypothetical protein
MFRYSPLIGLRLTGKAVARGKHNQSDKLTTSLMCGFGSELLRELPHT